MNNFEGVSRISPVVRKKLRRHLEEEGSGSRRTREQDEEVEEEEGQVGEDEGGEEDFTWRDNRSNEENAFSHTIIRSQLKL